MPQMKGLYATCDNMNESQFCNAIFEFWKCRFADDRITVFYGKWNEVKTTSIVYKKKKGRCSIETPTFFFYE